MISEEVDITSILKLQINSGNDIHIKARHLKGAISFSSRTIFWVESLILIFLKFDSESFSLSFSALSLESVSLPLSFVWPQQLPTALRPVTRQSLRHF
jgi:hypothetical protein